MIDRLGYFEAMINEDESTSNTTKKFLKSVPAPVMQSLLALYGTGATNLITRIVHRLYYLIVRHYS